MAPFMVLGAIGVSGSSASAQEVSDPQSINGLIRLFADSKNVLVRSFIEDAAVPLNSNTLLSLHWNNERVKVPAIEAPPGSQEAVDAITTASRPISGNAYEDYIKVRNELQGAVTRGGTSVSYYHSSETDYLAQQVAASYNRDVMNQQLNLSFGTSYGWDAIEPVANDNTNAQPDHKNTTHWDAVATDVLTPGTMVRAGVEWNHVEGLQHNPYRRVYAGGTSVPERHPSTRERRDAFIKVNQYLPNRSSLKLDYRLYADDWGVLSHEISSRLAQYITSGVYAQYEYRWYTQSAANFYMSEYPTTNGVDGYLTGDYRLGPLSSHLFGLTLNFDLGVLAADSKWFRPFDVALDYERYFNSNNYSADMLETGLTFRF